MTTMIRMSMFAFDEAKNMIGRITAGELVHPDDFDPEWVTEKEIRDAFTADRENDIAKLRGAGPYPKFCFGLIENVRV